MRAKDKCPSCFQPVAPTDFLCANCELILDPSQAPERPVGEVSVVRRMLEQPQRGLPSKKPNPKPPKSAPTEGLEGPTRKLDLGPELSGVPVVVATLSGLSQQLSEFEAYVVSQIDGLNDSAGLAKRAGVREFELRVVLRTLNEKRIIDFADEPLSDQDLDMPQVVGTLEEEDEMVTAPGFLDAPPPPAVQSPAVQSPAVQSPAVQSVQSYGSNADRRDARFAAPPARAAIPPMPANLPPAPPRAPVAVAKPPPPPADALPFAEREHTPIVVGKAEPPVLTPSSGRSALKQSEPPYPGASAEQKLGLPPSRAVSAMGAQPPPPPPMERTDPRIVYKGNVNRKVLDALKKVKRADPGGSAPSAPKEESQLPIADVLAKDTLQVALRMEQSGRLDEAIRFLEKSIAQSPEAASLYNRLGIILMRERADYRRAEILIRKATELAPDNTVYATNLQQVIQQHAMRSHR